LTSIHRACSDKAVEEMLGTDFKVFAGRRTREDLRRTYVGNQGGF
jgi:hypothetical protein